MKGKVVLTCVNVFQSALNFKSLIKMSVFVSSSFILRLLDTFNDEDHEH